MNTQTLPRETSGFLVSHVNKQLLKYAAGQNITCPGCGNIMDCRRTVTAELIRKAKGQPDAVVRSYVLCATCWDKVLPAINRGIARVQEKHPDLELTASLDIVDGRTFKW